MFHLRYIVRCLHEAALLNVFTEHDLIRNLKKSISVSLFQYLYSCICIPEYIFAVFTEVSLKYPVTSKKNVSQYLYLRLSAHVYLDICIPEYFFEYLCPALHCSLLSAN